MKFKILIPVYNDWRSVFKLLENINSYISISQSDKRTDYPGKEIAIKTQIIWSQDFDSEIEFVTGDEWKAGNLSYLSLIHI